MAPGPTPARSLLVGDANYNLCNFADPDHFEAFERLYEGFLSRIDPLTVDLIGADLDLNYNDCDEFYVTHRADRTPSVQPGTQLGRISDGLARIPNFRAATLDFSDLGLTSFSWEDDALEAFITYHFEAGHIDRLRFSDNPISPDDVDIADLPEGLLLVFDGGTGRRIGLTGNEYVVEEDGRALITVEFASVPIPDPDGGPGDDRADVCLQLTADDFRQWRFRVNATDRVRALFSLVIAAPSNDEIEQNYQLDLYLDIVPGCIGSAPQPQIDDGDLDEAVLTVIDNDAPRYSLCGRHPAIRKQIERWLAESAFCEQVSVADLARVTEIDLSGRSELTGIIAADFSQLSQLRSLDLRDSSLTAVPPGLLSSIGPTKTMVVDLRGNPGPDGNGFTLANLPAQFRADMRPGVEIVLEAGGSGITGFEESIYYADEGRPLAVGLIHDDSEAAGVAPSFLIRSEVRGHSAESNDLPGTAVVRVEIGSARLIALNFPEEKIDDREDEDFVLLMVNRAHPGVGRFTPIVDFANVQLSDANNYVMPGPLPEPEAVFPSIRVLKSRYEGVADHDVLGHNIPTLAVNLPGGGTAIADFAAHFERTGGLERWGYPISEVLVTEPGALSQYYQRGLVDFHDVGAGWVVERRLAWDYFGGGLGNSVDLGVEYAITNPFPGRMIGPWGHKVSNQAIDGTVTNFADFYDRLGGIESFGLPKSEARREGERDDALTYGQSGFIRQYFQAAVVEFHPVDGGSVKLALLGDGLRDLQLPNQSWRAFRSFLAAQPLAASDSYIPERVTLRI